MQTLLLWTGRIAGVLGLVICVVAIAVRMSGTYWAVGLQVGTLLQAGMALMLLGCLGFLSYLTRQR